MANSNASAPAGGRAALLYGILIVVLLAAAAQRLLVLDPWGVPFLAAAAPAVRQFVLLRRGR
jgi:hypothetical protein